ncbi:MAG: HEAT repeat domain-containing protein [Betaproteobacteria bacterium]
MPDIEMLGKRLKSNDAEERREAAVELCRVGRDAVPLLFRAMGDVDWRVRKTAVEGLVSIRGSRVIDGLLQALNAPDNAGVRNSAIEALVRIGAPSVDALLNLVEASDPDVRKFVVDILGDIKDPRATPALIGRLGDEDENVRVASAEALGKIRDPRAVDALLACLTHCDDGWLSYAAAEALGELGDERALGPLLAALSRSSLREPILESLGKIGNASALGPLISSLADPLRIVREVSTVAIATIYRKSAELARQKIIATVRAETTDRAVDSLEEILFTSSDELQKATIMLLGWSGREGSIRKLLAFLKEEDLEEPVVQSLQYLDRGNAAFLLGYLTSDNALVRRSVARVLGYLGMSTAEDSLIPLLRDENGHVRSTAAEALGRLQSRKAVAPLLTLLTDEYESVQESAIHALAVIGDESVLDDLVSQFSTHDAFMRRNIALLLGKFSSERAFDALAFALKDEEPKVRIAVVHSLGAVAGGRALRSLMLAITDDDPEVRMLAAEALGKISAPEAQDALISLLEDTDLWVRAAAARGLGGLEGDKSAEVLVSHLETAADIFLLAIVDALGKLKFPKALEPLLKLADHSDPEVRKTVLTALAGYDNESVQRAFIARLSDPHWSVRKAAVEELGQRRTGAADAILAKMAEEDPDTAVRKAANEALVK